MKNPRQYINARAVEKENLRMELARQAQEEKNAAFIGPIDPEGWLRELFA